MSKSSIESRIDKAFPSNGTLVLLLAPLSKGEVPRREGNMVVGKPEDIDQFLTPGERNGCIMVYQIGESDKGM